MTEFSLLDVSGFGGLIRLARRVPAPIAALGLGPRAENRLL